MDALDLFLVLFNYYFERRDPIPNNDTLTPPDTRNCQTDQDFRAFRARQFENSELKSNSCHSSLEEVKLKLKPTSIHLGTSLLSFPFLILLAFSIPIHLY